jgi:ATP-dependent Clp protease ATP-binding subunit ClpA
VQEGSGVAANVLRNMNIDLAKIRTEVEKLVKTGPSMVTMGQLPFTPRAKKVLELSRREAISLGHNYIGTEHILLGLARENEGVASQILLDFDVDAERIRNETIRMLSGQGGASTRRSPPFDRGPLLSAIRHVKKAKEEAIETGDFERAGELRDLQRELTDAARKLDHLLPATNERWEFRVVELTGEPETWAEQLRALAGDDWELVTVTGSHAILERPALG